MSQEIYVSIKDESLIFERTDGSEICGLSKDIFVKICKSKNKTIDEVLQEICVTIKTMLKNGDSDIGVQ